ncbi:hypothetical protein [Pacificispira sp.]|uniref:hypothetical protein n=1 Tax=Pacificispira sp. TaxID=2888761 RepID=UPI003B51DDE0
MSKLRALCATAVVAAVSLSGCQTNNGGSSPTADEERPRFYFNAAKPAGTQIVDLNACYDQRDDAESANAGYAAAGFLLGGIVGAIAVSSAREDSIETALSSCLANRGYEAVLVPENLDWIAFGLETADGRAESVQAFNQALSDTERDAWKTAVSQSTIVGYRAFVEAHPNGLLTQEAIFRHNRLVKFAQAQYDEAAWAGTATEPEPAVAPLTQNGTPSTSQVAAAPADAPNTWRGRTISQPSGAFFNDFCDVEESSRLVLRFEGEKFTGELIRAADGKIAKVSGIVSDNALTGRLTDNSAFTTPFQMTGRRNGNVIQGSIIKSATNGCSATFEVRSSIPNQVTAAALQQLAVAPPIVVAPSTHESNHWFGTAIGDGISSYGLVFCRNTDPARMSLKIQGEAFVGTIKERSGPVSNFDGRIVGDRLTARFLPAGTSVDFVIQGTISEDRISGNIYSPSSSNCGAKFNLKRK